MSVKALAERVLQGNRMGNQEETKSFLILQDRKPEKAPKETSLFGLTMADLEAELGADPDWLKIRSNPKLIQGYAETIATTRQVRAGQVPEGWTKIFQCARCGPIFLQPGGPKDLIGCPWCLNRVQGLPIPRPVRVNKPAAT